MVTSFSQVNSTDFDSCSGSQRELDHDRAFSAKLEMGLTKIENLTYRLEYLSSFVSAIQETLELSFFILRYCSKEVVGLTETARKTLESAGVVPYLWASCPERLMRHKRVYIRLLQSLHSSERYIAPQHRRRLRALLMPLTSHFSITKNSDPRTPNHDDRAETPLYRTIYVTPRLHGDQRMPPPPAPPIFRRRSKGSTRPIKRRLWTNEELIPPPPSHKHRTRRSRADSSDERDDQENSVPEENIVPFRQPRSTLRFGICFNRGSSSQQSGGWLSNT